jgi:Pyruvate/2-oxoacid:ferredoxin oxidoreductase gamma subunit
LKKKLTPEEVKSLAITQEARIVQIPLSESETSLAKDNLVQNSIKLSALQEELARVSEAIKIEIKKTKLDIKANLIDLRNGYVESEEECFLIDNQEDGVMEYYTEKGDMVFSRPLRPDERQEDAFSQQLKKVE